MVEFNKCKDGVENPTPEATHVSREWFTPRFGPEAVQRFEMNEEAKARILELIPKLCWHPTVSAEKGGLHGILTAVPQVGSEIEAIARTVIMQAQQAGSAEFITAWGHSDEFEYADGRWRLLSVDQRYGEAVRTRVFLLMDAVQRSITMIGIEVYSSSEVSRDSLATLRGAMTGQRAMVTVKPILAGKLRPGALFSAAGPEYWDQVNLRDYTVKPVVGEKVYIATGCCPPEQANDTVYELEVTHVRDRQFKSTLHEVVEAMRREGGSFVKALAEAYIRADDMNALVLRSAFRRYFMQYDEVVQARARQKASADAMTRAADIAPTSYRVTRRLSGVECHAVSLGRVRSVEHVVKHSPTGFEFGYLGSGPADLARSIVIDYTGDQDPEPRIYQTVKEKFIGPAQGEQFSIDAGELAECIEAAKKVGTA